MTYRKNKSPLNIYAGAIALVSRSMCFLLCMIVSVGALAEEVDGAAGGGAEYSTGLNYNGYDQHNIGVEPSIGPSAKPPTLGAKERGRVFEFWFLKKRSNGSDENAKSNKSEQSESLAVDPNQNR